MEYLKIDDTFFWKEVPILPGVYFIYSLNEKKPIETRRVLGLSPEAVDEVFSDFKVSEEFKQGVIKNSEIKNLALNE